MPHPVFIADENSPYGDLTTKEFFKKHQILHRESFMINNQNMKIFTQSLQPNNSPSQPQVLILILQSHNRPIKGFVAMVHGYSSKSSWLFELNTVFLLWIYKAMDILMAHLVTFLI
ncbi:hypothetical protein M9H77_11580 [Catharanthus roseus]|uniref:Uncharacterized protein n=1 Tax=Catharanthus roseus TaxID=4058 RepID=A0ACC0BF14_CATRO|nr:hypothetical protein M9H77_11580 [Catharanthus roseus]